MFRLFERTSDETHRTWQVKDCSAARQHKRFANCATDAFRCAPGAFDVFGAGCARFVESTRWAHCQTGLNTTPPSRRCQVAHNMFRNHSFPFYRTVASLVSHSCCEQEAVTSPVRWHTPGQSRASSRRSGHCMSFSVLSQLSELRQKTHPSVMHSPQPPTASLHERRFRSPRVRQSQATITYHGMCKQDIFKRSR